MKKTLRVAAVSLLLLAPCAEAQSLLGNALSFNGVNQYVTVANFGTIIPTNEITVEFWANTAKFASQSAFMLSPDASTNRFNAHLNYGSGYGDALTYWDFGNITGPGQGRMSTACPPNSITNWVHYALVASQGGNYMCIYTNGVLQISKSGMTPFVRGNYSLQIGGPGFPYSGSLDEFRVWSVARSQAQIQSDLYAPLMGSESNLVVYYKFDSASGTVATNYATATGAAYNGTLFNNPAWGGGTIPVPISLVTNLADFGSGTLRQAVSNTLPGGLINFAPNLSGRTILLTQGEISLSNSIIIDAASLSHGISISGNTTTRIFFVSSNQTVSLRGLTLTGGNGVGASLYGSGGAIENLGQLSVIQCTLLNNQASGNSAASVQGSGRGGGICNDSQTASLTAINSTFTGNQAGTYGGAIENRGALVAEYCTIYGNGSSSGGGGIDNFGNDYDQGGNYNASYTLVDSIVAGTIFTQDIRSEATTATRQGANIVPFTFELFGFSGSGPGYLGAAPTLAPLGNYGGPTQTMPPLPGSPAIDAGAVISGINTDQRGSARIVGAAPDLGGVESGGLWVQNNNDSGANSLRAILASAADVTSPKIILFTNSLSGQSIPLATQLLVTDPSGVTVDASSLPGGIQISGNGVTRVFYVTNNAIATLYSLTLVYGLAPAGVFAANGGGGGLFSRGRVSLLNCSIVNNLVIAGSTFGYAGGIACDYGGDVRMTNCTVAFNQVFGPNGVAGAFWNEGGMMLLDHCTFANNTAALYSGGVVSGGGSNVVHATVLADGNSDLVNLSTTISLGNNFIADGSGNSLPNGANGDQIGSGGTVADAGLAPLGNYGGSTPTMPPLPGSPVIDGGGVTTLATDQRGYPRPAGPTSDIGAVEGIYLAAGPGKFTSTTRLGDGSIQLGFTNYPGANLSVLAAPSLTPPLTWVPIGFATETPAGSGLYQFIDPQAAGKFSQRYYQLKSP